ncbi:MAG: HNH endonuclease [Chloroflexi bacterium]|nr:MAG: HNH endonuclease [Chloroflexota bacterium]
MPAGCRGGRRGGRRRGPVPPCILLPRPVKGSPTARGYGADWQRVRLAILERDGWRCRWCGLRATTVDHVRPLCAGGARLDPANLVAACVGCNSRRGARFSSRRRSRPLAAGSGFLVPADAARRR